MESAQVKIMLLLSIPLSSWGSLYNAGAPGALLWPFPGNLAGNWGPSPTAAHYTPKVWGVCSSNPVV
jgi:hypothetical protein